MTEDSVPNNGDGLTFERHLSESSDELQLLYPSDDEEFSSAPAKEDADWPNAQEQEYTYSEPPSITLNGVPLLLSSGEESGEGQESSVNFAKQSTEIMAVDRFENEVCEDGSDDREGKRKWTETELFGSSTDEDEEGAAESPPSEPQVSAVLSPLSLYCGTAVLGTPSTSQNTPSSLFPPSHIPSVSRSVSEPSETARSILRGILEAKAKINSQTGEVIASSTRSRSHSWAGSSNVRDRDASSKTSSKRKAHSSTPSSTSSPSGSDTDDSEYLPCKDNATDHSSDSVTGEESMSLHASRNRPVTRASLRMGQQKPESTTKRRRRS